MAAKFPRRIWTNWQTLEFASHSFITAPKCETTRATLLSGKYHHQVKIARLQNCRTIAEHLRQLKYRTLMTGKWHMDQTPLERGFQRYFGHLSGATNFFTGDDTFLLGDQPFSVPANGFYTTDANVDYALEFLNASPLDQPLFCMSPSTLRIIRCKRRKAK
ncbi:MAG: sulfatase-like hydrolase/transferase [Pirellulaceae bacterium]